MRRREFPCALGTGREGAKLSQLFASHVRLDNLSPAGNLQIMRQCRQIRNQVLQHAHSLPLSHSFSHSHSLPLLQRLRRLQAVSPLHVNHQTKLRRSEPCNRQCTATSIQTFCPPLSLSMPAPLPPLCPGMSTWHFGHILAAKLAA